MKELLNISGDGELNPLLSCFSVPGQPLNFKAEPESETSILLSWTPPRSDTIANYELVYKDGEHGEEVGLCSHVNIHYIEAIFEFRGFAQILLKDQKSIENLVEFRSS